MSDTGVWKRALLYLGLVDQDELEETDEVSYEEPVPESPIGIRKLSREELSTVHPLQPVPAPVNQVHIVEPRAFKDAQDIGDKLRDSIPVLVNLQGVDEDLLTKVTHFAFGAAYVLGGGVQRVAPRVFLITPANVEVSAEDRRRLAERGLFDDI